MGFVLDVTYVPTADGCR